MEQEEKVEGGYRNSSIERDLQIAGLYLSTEGQQDFLSRKGLLYILQVVQTHRALFPCVDPPAPWRARQPLRTN